MKTNKKVNGIPIFCNEEYIKTKSLMIYGRLTCMANLRDTVSCVRIFQQRDVNLAEIKRIFKMDERTIKKCWEQLEMAGLIIYKKAEDPTINFVERWKERRKYKDVYYEIPCPIPYRKIPKKTLKELEENDNVSELTYKIYVILVNYQEVAILENKTKKFFTYRDIRTLLGYEKHVDIDKKIEESLNTLQGLGLIEVGTSFTYNKYKSRIPVFILYEANFYTNYSIKDFKTAEENVIEPTIQKEIKAQEYVFCDKIENIVSQFTFSGARNSIQQLIDKGYKQDLIAFCIEEKSIVEINKYATQNHKNGLGFLFYNNCEVLEIAKEDYEEVIEARLKKAYQSYCSAPWSKSITYEEWEIKQSV